MDRLFDGVIGVAARGVDVGNCVTRRAGDARFCRRVIYIIELRVIECAAKERHRVMATGAPARSLDRAVALQRDFARFADAEEISRIVNELVS